MNDDIAIAELVVSDLVSRFGPVSVDTALSQAIVELRSEMGRALTDIHESIAMRRALGSGPPSQAYEALLRLIIESRTC